MASPGCRGKEVEAAVSAEIWVSFPVNTAWSLAGAGSLGPAQPWSSSQGLRRGVRRELGWELTDHPDPTAQGPGGFSHPGLPLTCLCLLFVCLFNKDKGLFQHHW